MAFKVPLIKLRLWHKGVGLVFALLAVELTLMAAMVKLLNDAELEAARAQKAETATRAATMLAETYFKIGSNLALYMAMPTPKNESRFEKARKEAPGRFEELKEALDEDPRAMSVIQPLENSLKACEEELVRAKNTVANGEDFSGRDVRKKILPQVKNIVETLRGISDENERVAKEEVPRMQMRTRAQLKRYIALGVITNVVFAFAIILFGARDIVRKLNKLADNTQRLAQGRDLQPVMSGGDEFSNLDQVFHDMAAALEEASRKTTSIIEHMPVGLVTFDRDGRIDTINPRIEQMFKSLAYDLHGENIMTLFAPSARPEGDKFMMDLQSRCLNRVSEFKAQASDGTIFPVEVSMNEYGTDGAEVYLASLLDISERHEVERLKREFVAMVSHDLRTPLTSVEASLTLLAAGALGALPPDAVHTVRIAETEIGRLRGLVNDLLDIAKIEAGKMDMTLDDVSLFEVVDQSIHSVEALANERNIKIEYDEEDAIAFADGNRLIQVLVNFLSNAVKYSPDGSVVRVEVRSTPDWHEVRVIDHGPGIAAEHHELVFHRFGQANGQHQKEGTGLGLAIAKTIIEQHGGTIGLDSEPGNGSQFWFRLPVSTTAAAILPAETPQSSVVVHGI
jgi:PAS domain S-box-containing protein